MDLQGEICARYEAELSSIAALDSKYYVNPAPTSAERASYYQRQEQLERIRAGLYAELRGAGRFVCKSLKLLDEPL